MQSAVPAFLAWRVSTTASWERLAGVRVTVRNGLAAATVVAFCAEPGDEEGGEEGGGDACCAYDHAESAGVDGGQALGRNICRPDVHVLGDGDGGGDEQAEGK